MTAEPAQNLILDRDQITQKVIRMAYEVYERNFEEQEVVLAGIHHNGYTLAEMLAGHLQNISPITVHLLRVSLNKDTPLEEPIDLHPDDMNLENMSVVLVDDVLYTGKTLAYTLNSFLTLNPKKVEIATLVDRHHPRYPIASTYTGYSLATTINERIDVILEGEQFGAYLH